MREPAFWWREAGLAAGLLAPFAALYGAVASARLRQRGARAAAPVKIDLAAFTLMSRLMQDAEVRKVIHGAPLAEAAAEGLFLLNVQLEKDADAEAVRKLLLDRVARMTTPDGWPDVQITRMKQEFVQMLQPIDLEKLQLPPNVSKAMARGNLELQRMIREIVVADFRFGVLLEQFLLCRCSLCLLRLQRVRDRRSRGRLKMG